MQPWQPMPPPPQPSAATGRPARPTAVTVGALGLVVSVVLCLAEVGVVTVGMVKQAAKSKQDYGADSSDLKLLTGLFIVLIAINVVLAFGLMGGALAALRGRTSGLVLAWVFGGPAILLRCGCGGIGGFGLYDSTANGGVNPFPNWLFGVDIAIDAVALVVILTAMIVLMLGSSRRYFRGAT
jgi:hypothetical protein